MSVDLDHPVVAAYLAQLEGAAVSAGLPAGRRAELRAEISAHVLDALGAEPGVTDTAVGDVLDRLGPVEDIVGAEQAAEPARPGWPMSGTAPAPAAAVPGPGPWGALEYVALALLTVGQVVLVLGPVAGVACAWASTRWSRGGKIAATVLGLVLPVLLVLAASAFWLFGASVGSGPSPVDVTVVPTPSPLSP